MNSRCRLAQRQKEFLDKLHSSSTARHSLELSGLVKGKSRKSIQVEFVRKKIFVAVAELLGTNKSRITVTIMALSFPVGLWKAPARSSSGRGEAKQ